MRSGPLGEPVCDFSSESLVTFWLATEVVLGPQIDDFGNAAAAACWIICPRAISGPRITERIACRLEVILGNNTCAKYNALL
jgi:hypothetical protein